MYVGTAKVSSLCSRPCATCRALSSHRQREPQPKRQTNNPTNEKSKLRRRRRRACPGNPQSPQSISPRGLQEGVNHSPLSLPARVPVLTLSRASPSGRLHELVNPQQGPNMKTKNTTLDQAFPEKAALPPVFNLSALSVEARRDLRAIVSREMSRAASIRGRFMGPGDTVENRKRCSALMECLRAVDSTL
jgi:hypothetical protein